MEQNISDIKIDQLDLKTFIKTNLKESGKETLGDLFQMNLDDFYRVPKLGTQSINDIKELLYKYGHKIPGVEYTELNEDGTINPRAFYIKDLPIKNGLKNTLYRANYRTLDDLLTSSADDLMKIPRLGIKGYEELIEFLSLYGYKVEYVEKTKLNEDGTINPSTYYIKSLNLSRRTTNLLYRSDIRTLEQLLSFDFSKIRGFGKTSFDEIQSVLNKIGYSMKKEFEEVKASTEEKITPSTYPIELLGLKEKTLDLLNGVGVTTLLQLIRMDWGDLSKIEGFDAECLKDLRIALNNLGYSIKDETIEERKEIQPKKSLKLEPKNDNQ